MKCHKSMYIIFGVVLCMFNGCVTVEKSQNEPEQAQHNLNKKPLTEFHNVKLGMSLMDVQKMMKDHVIVGYEKPKEAQKALDAIVVKSPYKRETLVTPKGVHNVLYYFTHIVKEDGVISQEELTPFVFRDQKLISLEKLAFCSCAR